MLKKSCLVITVLTMLYMVKLQAQERLWVTDSQGRLISMKTDGTDVFFRSDFEESDFGRWIAGIELIKGVPNYDGQLVIASADGSSNEEGATSVIGPNGLRRIYYHDYLESRSCGGLTCTSTGIVAARGDVIYGKWRGINRIPYDGSDSESYNKANQNYSPEYQLINVNDTIYGVSSGDSNNKGFIYRILPTEYNGTPAGHVYDFMLDDQGIRPTGRLSYGNGFLFGSTKLGGQNNKGVFFKVRKDGTGYEKLFDRAFTSLAKRESDGIYHTLLAAIAEGYVPLTDQEGNYIINDEQGIYKVSNSGHLVIAISNVNATDMELVSPQFQHHVKVSNIANGASEMPEIFTVEVAEFVGADVYELQLSTTPDFSANVSSTRHDDEYFFLVLDPGTTYYTRVRTDLWPYFGEVVSFTTAVRDTIAPVRLYVDGMSGDYSVNRDGSDQHFFEEAVDQGMLQLDNGDKVFMTGPDPVRGEGDAAIWKITPFGKQFLYQGYFNQLGIHPQYMVDGGDGYFYGIQYHAAASHMSGIVRFKIDGSSMEVHAKTVSSVLRSTYLTKTPQGIFLTSVGAGYLGGSVFKFVGAFGSNEFGFGTLHLFSEATGKRPYGKLLAGRDGYLYGTTRIGGANNAGVIFKVSPVNYEDYTVLHHFLPIDGKNPITGLVQDSNGTLYGSTSLGGKNSYGVLYKINEDGTGFQKLIDYFYTGGENVSGSVSTDDSFVYAIGGHGVFKIRKDGSGYMELGVPARSFQTLPNTDNYMDAVDPLGPESPIAINSVVHFSPIPGAKRYYLEVSLSPKFDTGVLSFENDSAHFAMDGLTYNRIYFTRGRTNLTPAYSPTYVFRTNDASSHAYVIDPATGMVDFGTLIGDTDVRGWVTLNGLRGAQQYYLQVSDYFEFYDWSIQEYHVAASIGNPKVYLQHLSPGQTYYARVRTDLSSKWGPMTTFTTKTVSSSRTSQPMQVYPNPSRNCFNLQRGDEEILEVIVRDATGNVVFQENNVSQALLFGEKLSKGLYVMTVRLSNKTETIRLSKE